MYSFVVIIILDLLLSIVLDQIYLAIWPVAPTLFGGYELSRGSGLVS